ncbi:MAG: M20/M25/M40 family metallo-hydrolase [Nitrososphaerota archaeon]|jgi:acetylornithine deacetylase/succinyl-diaminopimelate desuccinylase-like protein|nr:M20/M25/M40 family metallo-hydrolase [Nitrososphaerota archaeon]MDG6922307.1 M20/M25/M40 family metallo-hydrolase [Nitrososphaerota archaeon]
MKTPDSVGRAWYYAENNKSRFIEELKELVSQPSVSAQNMGLKECSELVRRKMVELGIKTKVFPVQYGPDVIYGELSGAKNARTLVIYNHYDVQPAEPLNEWKSDPFKPEIRNGCIYGRGVGDDKGELAARLNAVESLLETEGSVKPNIKWIVEGEEEVGSPHFHSFVMQNKSMLSGNGCLWEEGDRTPSGTAEIHLGVKGLLYVEFSLKVGEKDQHSMYGPIAPNPAWRIVNLLKTIRNEDGRVLIEGFYDDVAKPTSEELKVIKKNEFSSESLKEALQLDYIYSGKSDTETAKKLLYEPTANVAGFGSGYTGQGSKTIVPKEALAKMDFRLVANMNADDILAKLRRHMKKHGFQDVKLTVHSKENPAKTPLNSHIAQVMITCSTMAEGKRPNVWPTIWGTGPLSLFTKTLKLPTAMGLGVNYAGAGFHAPNEHVVLDYYHRAVKQLICLFALF